MRIPKQPKPGKAGQDGPKPDATALATLEKETQEATRPDSLGQTVKGKEPKPSVQHYNINTELGRRNAFTDAADDLLAVAERQNNLSRNFDDQPHIQVKYLHARDVVIEAAKALKQKSLEIDSRLR